ncbi:hypothetical protein H696_04294 [Fonticula alba]|uniref:CBF1-interacting co-repressor CIR N-terminal domain-containing protein n=1 Tax=Fonticula alba TaxID=691883 RepID=A0A058Z410_FONAL|nr:hypothetical protein H696_04294 [Fonticula alba]KCV68876.1 hypothetical protein H696_04294 [Fonticula alba]|eukprot:XP_009496447.1 hypothetical protein H696_04294 [Fonticula alba]
MTRYMSAKSYHPNSMANRRRVWEAEQRAADDERRRRDRERQLRDERSAAATGPRSSVDFLYSREDRARQQEAVGFVPASSASGRGRPRSPGPANRAAADAPGGRHHRRSGFEAGEDPGLDFANGDDADDDDDDTEGSGLARAHVRHRGQRPDRRAPGPEAASDTGAVVPPDGPGHYDDYTASLTRYIRRPAGRTAPAARLPAAAVQLEPEPEPEPDKSLTARAPGSRPYFRHGARDEDRAQAAAARYLHREDPFAAGSALDSAPGPGLSNVSDDVLLQAALLLEARPEDMVTTPGGPGMPGATGAGAAPGRSLGGGLRLRPSATAIVAPYAAPHGRAPAAASAPSPGPASAARPTVALGPESGETERAAAARALYLRRAVETGDPHIRWLGQLSLQQRRNLWRAIQIQRAAGRRAH